MIVTIDRKTGKKTYADTTEESIDYNPLAIAIAKFLTEREEKKMKQINIAMEPEQVEEVREAIINQVPGLYLAYDESQNPNWPWVAYDNTGEALLTEAFQTAEGALRWLLYEERTNAPA